MDILWINFLPFIGALLLQLPLLKQESTKTVQIIGTTALMGSLFIGLLSFLPDIEAEGSVYRAIQWQDELGLTLSLYLDGLALLFGLVVSGIGTAIFLYAGFYFEKADELRRFNTLMMAFTGAMLGLVLSGNLLTMFIMWELTSIISFLLIGFKGNKYKAARDGATQALIITGAGGLALLAGVLLLGAASGDLNGTGFTLDMRDILATEGLTDHGWYTAIAILMMIGAFTKSAQFPFHFWLPGGMSAPTPASAFLHSATMVKAGVYLLARLYPVMSGTDLWMYGLMGAGMITMLIGSLFALTKYDLKGLLAYSTITQLGAFVMLLGIPDYIGYKAVMVGILAHALYKSALFLVVGTIDHAMETRDMSKLGAVAKLMPITAAVGIISAISMAGIPFWFGFVAKEVLIAAAMDATMINFVTEVVFISGALTAAVGFIFIWDVFFKPAPEAPHYHAMKPQINIGPATLAGGSLFLGFLLDPLIIPLVELAVPKSFELKLFPGFITEFYISLAAIVVGAAVFVSRQMWQPYVMNGVLPISGTQVYDAIIGSVQWFGDQLLRSQSGKLRYYLASILGVLAVVFLASGLIVDLINTEDVLPTEFAPVRTDAIDVLFLLLTISSAIVSVIVKRHLYAILSLGIMGYAVAGIFLIEKAPDVALVQFMVETLATVLLIIILSRTSKDLRDSAADTIWRGTNGSSIGLWRDAIIAAVIGACVFIFTLIAMTNRPERDSISAWHIQNAEPEVGVTDIVSAILTDFRGMDTLVEIGVFAIAALGIWSLFSVTKSEMNVPASKENDIRIGLSNPFTRATTLIVLPGALMIAIVHILYGAKAPGDGFTAGVISSLGISLWYMVFGYEEVRARLPWWRPLRFLSFGLFLGLANAILPIIVDGGAFMGLMKIDDFSPAELKFSTTLVFEIAIGLTVFGSVGIILEAVAHPERETDIPDQEKDDRNKAGTHKE